MAENVKPAGTEGRRAASRWAFIAVAAMVLLTALTIWKGPASTTVATTRDAAIRGGELVKLGPENIYNFSIIPGGKLIISDQDGKIAVLQPDGSLKALIGSDSVRTSQPAWSPDGKRYAFIDDKNNAGSSLWIANADGTGLALLTKLDDTPNVYYQKPAWSPDGQWIALTREVIVNYPTHGHYTSSLTIWIVRSDGTGLRQVTDGNNPAWSPDGQKLAFELRPHPSTVTGSEIWMCDLGGTNLQRVTDGVEPAWSPDGHSIAYVRIVAVTAALGNDSTGTPLCRVCWDGREIWVISLSNGQATRLTESRMNDEVANNWLQETRLRGGQANDNLLIASGMYDDWSPTWLPDSKSLIFSRDYNNEKGPHFVLYRVDLKQ